MEYFVIYDKNDNVVALCENLEELSRFVNRRKKELKYRFKNKNLFYIQVPSLLKIYKFNWGGRTSIFLVLYLNHRKECKKWIT